LIACGAPHQSTFTSILVVGVGVGFVVSIFLCVEHGGSLLGPLGPLAIICAYINNLQKNQLIELTSELQKQLIKFLRSKGLSGISS